jgi:hypothetical protein
MFIVRVTWGRKAAAATRFLFGLNASRYAHCQRLFCDARAAML